MSDGLDTAECSRCGTETALANLDDCLICDFSNDVCSECLRLHTATHSQADVENRIAELEI